MNAPSVLRYAPRRLPRTYWRMVFLAIGLADDPWEPAVLLDQDKQFCGRMPIPDAAALVEGVWDSLRHAEQDIADEGQPGFLARTERTRTIVIRAGRDVLSIDGDDAADVPKILTLYRAVGDVGGQALMLASGRVPNIPNRTAGGPNPFGLHLWAWGLSHEQVEHFQALAQSVSGDHPFFEPHGLRTRAGRTCTPSGTRCREADCGHGRSRRARAAAALWRP